MPRSPQLYDWSQLVATRFPDLPRHQATALAEWSFGLVLAHACGLSAVALVVASVARQSVSTVRQRLRELYQPADRKAGRQRTTFDPTACCCALIRWIASTWTDKRLALALDVTNLADRFHVLTVAILYRGCGIPVAWAVLPANTKDPWQPYWEALLGRVAPALGDGWQVFVLSDRGLESQALFRAITAHGWHPLMRMKGAGRFRPTGWHGWYPAAAFARRVGDRFAAVGTAYKTAPLNGTLLACHADGCSEPWLILTDLPPAAADAAWYAYRSWIEQGFKIAKSGGWHWQRTRMTDPDRVERLWAAVALATVWLVEVGGLAEFEPQAETIPPIRVRRSDRPRVHRLVRVGWALIVAGLIQQRLVTGRLEPEPWPAPTPFAEVTEEKFKADMTYP
jgi:hypothetical protein